MGFCFKIKEKCYESHIVNVIGSFNEYHKEKGNIDARVETTPCFISHVPIGFFDGGSQDDGARCGVGMLLKVTKIHMSLSIKWVWKGNKYQWRNSRTMGTFIF